MEPQNTNPIAPVEPKPTAAASTTSTPNPVAPTTTPTSTVSAAPVTQPVAPVSGAQTPAPRKLNIPKINMKELPGKIKALPLKFKLMGGFVLLLIVLLILASFTKQGRQVKNIILPTPQATLIPASTPVEQVLTPTQYTNDPEILDIEKSMKDFDTKLGGTDLKEDSLRVPNLDYNVNFKTQ